LAKVDFGTGGHRIQAVFDHEPDGGVYNDIVALGADAETSAIVSYQTGDPHVRLELETAEESEPIDTSNVSELADDFKRSSFLDLNPGTEYRYRFLAYDRASAWRTFATPDPDQFSFVFAADSQANSVLEAQTLNRMLTAAEVYEPDISFGLTTGDVVEIGANEKMWEWFFETTSMRRRLPYMATTGNHDYYNPGYEWNDNQTFEKYLPHPQNGIGGKSSYYFKVGTTLFIMLDAVASDYGSDQIAWFENVIATQDEGLVIVATHYSAYGAHHATTASSFEDTWVPVFDENDVDLVLSGHDHLFLRTPPLTSGEADRDQGVVYLTGGSASAKIYDVPTEDIPFYDFALTSRQNLVTIFTITGTYLQATAINQYGAAIDSFMIGEI
jgi:hypothetical protein